MRIERVEEGLERDPCVGKVGKQIWYDRYGIIPGKGSDDWMGK